MDILATDALKLVLSIVVGGVIGLQRELSSHPAGFRTNILICLGTTAFGILSYRMAVNGDPNRIAAAILTGIGFLGAGAIMRDAGHVVGLTTAASIWVVAALGVGIAGEQYGLVAVGTLLTFIVLSEFPDLVDRFRVRHLTVRYEIASHNEPQEAERLGEVLRSNGLHATLRTQAKRDGVLITIWEASGGLENHRQVEALLLIDPSVRSFRY